MGEPADGGEGKWVVLVHNCLVGKHRCIGLYPTMNSCFAFVFELGDSVAVCSLCTFRISEHNNLNNNYKAKLSVLVDVIQSN